ncbi:esterase/lipase family protein [Vibrio hippocampi]|uniref:GPI inositol-deacylase PGAP1-like alpha/beta domain-containing protein n=1 Tax=Vibrio hippocampi TaxID=654686 RepID=A0ABN8DDM3_9VIBR|nr:triacylglycerol lipase [Vibrio hippocampi]CAH0524394.1 hypothetical protein VHP8226_00221 [Vibrio hippocampi]
MNIIILHGLYMHGIVMRPLSQNIRELGYTTQIVTYNTLAINEEKLFASIDHALSRSSTNVLVGHSLGGIVIKHYLTSRKPCVQTISHVVTIGSPLQGASVVERVEKLGLGALLGNSGSFGLKAHQDIWQHPQKLGSIAGDIPVGVRPLLMMSRSESDGTVTVEETRIEGMTDHIVTQQTHTSLIYSRFVSQQIDHFIRYDGFKHGS